MRHWAFVAALCLCGCGVDGHLWAPEPGLERMLEQPRADPYEWLPGSARPAMRAPPAGTVARGARDEARPPRSLARLAHGRRKFDAHCAPCHGVRGDGQSEVARHMTLVKPGSLLSDAARQMSDEAHYALLRDGRGLMPALAVELDAADRWAVVGYLRALQLSQAAPVARLPPALRAALDRSAP